MYSNKSEKNICYILILNNMESIIQFDQSLFLILNRLHADWLDPIMNIISNRWTWIPLYLFILIWTFMKYKKRGVLTTLSLILLLTLTDQTCNLIKGSVQRDRPSHKVQLEQQVHLYQRSDGTFYRGGQFGFPSAHAANSLLFALYVILFLANRNRWIIAAALLWSLLLSYSRIYLGVHYPGDLIAGWGVALIIGYPLFRLTKKWVLHPKKDSITPQKQ